MHVDVIDSFAEFAAIEADWNNAYLADPFARFFLSWVWLSRIFQEYPDEWRVLAVRHDGCDQPYIGFLPLNTTTVWSRSKHRFRNELHLAGTLFWSQYTGFVSHPAEDHLVMPALAIKLQELNWSRLSLKYIHASEARLSLFTSAFPSEHFRTTSHERWINKGKTNNLVCPYIELPDDYDAYLLSQLSANTRQKIRRYTRKFEASGRFAITCADANSIERDIDILIELWLQRWSASKGRKAEGLARKFRRILHHAFACDSIYLPVLWDGDTPLAALANFIDRTKGDVFFFVTGRDERCEERWIGTMLNVHAIRWAIENRMKHYDFCHGDEAYKYSYGAKDHVLEHLIVSHRSGLNLHETLDPICVPEVMARVVELIDENRLDEAKIACRQVRKVIRAERA